MDWMIGITFHSVNNLDNDVLLMNGLFLGEDIEVKFWHENDCCETVRIAEIYGNLEDLTGMPIEQAECITEKSMIESGSQTWTFYKFATNKGSITIRWLGKSNGYYSEKVSCNINGKRNAREVITNIYNKTILKLSGVE